MISPHELRAYLSNRWHVQDDVPGDGPLALLDASDPEFASALIYSNSDSSYRIEDIEGRTILTGRSLVELAEEAESIFEPINRARPRMH